MKAKDWKGTMNQGTLATNSEWDAWIEFKMKEVIELGFLSLKKNLPSFKLQYLKNKLFPSSHMSRVQGLRSYKKRFRMKDIQWLLMSTSVLLGRKKHIAELLHFFSHGLAPFPQAPERLHPGYLWFLYLPSGSIQKFF